ncbi:MAG TPA: CpaF family protein [Chloroflexota bacterium]|nr:CpaF family protein [Chloroflexota bacterium]
MKGASVITRPPAGVPARGPFEDGAVAAAPLAPPPDERKLPTVPSAASVERQRLAQLKTQVQRWLVDVLNPGAELERDGAQLRGMIDGYLDQVLAQEGLALTRTDRTRLLEGVVAELLAYGPIEPLLHDETVTEVMVNGPDQVWVERGGVIEDTEVRFENDEHVRRIIDRIVSPLGRRCDESSPMVDARLPDGSRVNAIIPPLSLIGPCITIRKFSKKPLTVQNLVEFGSLSPEVADFLAACVRGKANVLISGGTGSGKTTLLNVLSGFIPDRERIVTIEDAAELQLRQRHVIPLEARPANLEGAGAIPIRQLVINALRMRPDRIVVGECRGAEALDMLQAMNTGHDGSMTTLHANSPRDALARIETMVLMAGTDLPHRAIREQIAAALDVIVQQERMQDGGRRVIEISEVQGMEGDVIVLEPLYRFVHKGFEGRRIAGRLEPLGVRPKLSKKLEQYGVALPAGIFEPRPSAA